MNDFKVIYRILKYLEASMGCEEFDPEGISSSRLKVPEERIEQLLIMMQESGYVNGLVVTQTLSDRFPHLVAPVQPRITIKGLEYLTENSMMKKAANLLKGVVEIVH